MSGVFFVAVYENKCKRSFRITDTYPRSKEGIYWREKEDYGYKFIYKNMSEQIKVNFKSFQGVDLNKFALEQSLAKPGVNREYLIRNNWTRDVDGKPEETRAVFDNAQTFRAAKAAYFAWKDLQGIFPDGLPKEKPVFPEEIFERMRSSVLRLEPLVFFIPWGYRYDGMFGDKERKAMNRIDITQATFLNRGVTVRVLLMPADIYAKEVNGINSEPVDEYFSDVENEASVRGYEVAPWSSIREANLERYYKLSFSLTKNKIKQILPVDVINSALEAARKRSGQTDKKAIQESAFLYLRERLCEAEIIENQFKPVKLSMVSKRKDNGVDSLLPRLYILSQQLQFPWL